MAKLEQACTSNLISSTSTPGCLGEDPALDQFMEAYCEMLTKYEQELSKPFKEAMLFLQKIEYQFKSLAISSTSDSGNNFFLSFVYWSLVYVIVQLAYAWLLFCFQEVDLN